MVGLKLRGPRQQQIMASPPYYKWTDESGEVIASFFRVSLDYLVRFPERADFWIAYETSDVSCAPVPGIAAGDISNLYHHQILPLIQSRSGRLIIHASAVLIDGKSAAFAGKSGRGKSTLAAAFAQAGFPFLTDDDLAFDKKSDVYFAQPSRAILRLLPDSRSALLSATRTDAEGDGEFKREVPTGPDLRHEPHSKKVGAIYLLGESRHAKFSIRRMAPAAALIEIMKHSFFLDIDDRSRLHSHFDALGDFVESVSCFELDFPRDFGELDQTIGGILNHFQTGI